MTRGLIILCVTISDEGREGKADGKVAKLQIVLFSFAKIELYSTRKPTLLWGTYQSFLLSMI